jgi:hypothetical protein
MKRPVISVKSPEAVVTLMVPDSVLLIADIHDDVSIKSIRVVLVNSDRISVGNPTMYFPDASAFTIEQYVHVSDKFLSSGDYSILIYVSDGKNSISSYVPLIINEMPKEVSGYLITEKLGTYQTRLNFWSSNLVPDTSVLLQLDYSSSGINHPYEQLYVVTTEPSQILALSLKRKEMNWTLQAALPYPRFTVPYVDDDLVIGTGNGDVFVYDQEGNVKVKTLPKEDFKVEQVAANEDFIICEMVSFNGNDHFLYTFYRKTGGLNRNRKLDGDITTLVPMENKCIVVLFTGQHSKIYSLEPVEGILTFENECQGKFILGSAKIDSDRMLFYTEDVIYLYDYQYNNLIPYLDIKVRGVQYDPVRSSILYFDDEGIGIIEYPGGELLGNGTFDGQVLNFQVIYNK